MRFLFLIICLQLSLAVCGQRANYNFTKLNTYNGLSQNQVNTILKDTDGFLWFGTLSGLNRYDGYLFKVFRKQLNDSASVLDNNILSLYELPGGKMWVTTMPGPCIYNSHTEKFDSNYNNYLRSLGLPAGTINNIVKGNDGRYWFIYDNLDLYLYSTRDKIAKKFNQNDPLHAAEKIVSVIEAKDGKLWVLYQSGFLCKYDIKSKTTIFSSKVFQELNNESKPTNLFVDNDGEVWLWYKTYGVFLLHPSDNSVKYFSENTPPSKLSSSLVSQVVQDDDGLIWVATDHGGVTLIDKKKDFQTSYLLNDPKDARSLGQNSITAIYKDDNGIIWLGTYKQGVNYLNNTIVQFPWYHHQESNSKSLPFDDVNRFVEDKRGNIWIGTNGGGLIYFDRKNNLYNQYLHEPGNKNSLSNNVVVSLCIDHEGILWIGTYYGGLNSFDGKKFTHYLQNDKDSSSLSNNKVWEIFEDRDQQLWIGTLGNGLDKLNRRTGRFEHFQYKEWKPGSILSNYISAILQDRAGNLWVGAENGVTVLPKSGGVPILYQQKNSSGSLSSNNIICLFEDSKGRIWVGTREGLNLFNTQTKSFQIFTTKDGLPDNFILNILEDKKQTLWISTPNGFCNVIPNQNEGGLSFSVINYNEMNNLQSLEFNENAALKTTAGELIFGGPFGFNIIDPDKIKEQIYHPKIVLTELQVLNKTVEPGEVINGRVLIQQAISKLQQIDLKYKENIFSIEFASLDFAHSNRDKYAYMLKGFNSDWLYADATQRRATYTNLDPGHYTFKVKVLSNSGVWSEEKIMHIDIAPPLWRTAAAYILYALLILGLLFLIRRITLDRIHMRYDVEQQRQEAEKAHAIDQVKTTFFTNVSHEFRTPLSLIIAPLEKIIKQATDDEQKKQLGVVQRNAKRLLTLVNQLLDFRKMQVQEVKLHLSIGDIVAFCKDISQSFMDIAERKSISFSISSDIEQLEIYFDKDKIEKILFNLLSNAFKFTHHNGMVSIHLSNKPAVDNESDGSFVIEVKDNGIGIPADNQEKIFEQFFQNDVPESMVNQGSGIGLAITKEFVKIHNGVITIKSEPGLGSCFTVLLPAKKIHEPSIRTTSTLVETEGMEELLPDDHHKKDRKKTIVLVEDNEDLRFYLKDNLKGQYHIKEAANGKEGWDLIKRLTPDLVISDIMMPLMDGIELSRKIKTETITAHIPIILLTAMGSEEKQLEGLRVGVNDYITKPFTFEILASRISNLLAQQQLLQQRFQKQIDVNPEEVTITPVDEKFLKQALELVEKNIGNADFSVEDFSRDMFMNRVTLYRKILSITGKTPIEFIRSIRLKRAARLLEKSGLSVAEIAYDVGFNNPKNFSKAFKEEFKVLPSQYVANKKEKNS